MRAASRRNRATSIGEIMTTTLPRYLRASLESLLGLDAAMRVRLHVQLQGARLIQADRGAARRRAPDCSSSSRARPTL